MDCFGYTDLALELQEELSEEEKERGEGYSIQTRGRQEGTLKETVIAIKDERGERLFGKPRGVYITLEGENLAENDGAYHEGMSRLFAEHMSRMLKGKRKVLFAGLGNAQVTPDALGPMVMDNLLVTAHLSSLSCFKNMLYSYAVVPGVMARTGMETVNVLRGMAEQVRPEVLVIIDALAAKTYERLHRTIQISDTGLAPGAGVGNHRKEISINTVGVPVIAVGVPTVISMPALAENVLTAFFEEAKTGGEFKNFPFWSDREKYKYMARILPDELFSLMVTPKEVDAAVKRISYTISEGLNQVIACGQKGFQEK